MAKCLILGQDFAQNYDEIVWIDSDTMINALPPDPAAGVPLDKVDATYEARFSPVYLKRAFKLWPTSIKRLAFRNGFPYGFNKVLSQEVRFWCLHCQGDSKRGDAVLATARPESVRSEFAPAQAIHGCTQAQVKVLNSADL